MFNQSNKFPLRKLYAIGHLLLVAICLFVCLFFFKHWVLAIAFYIIGNIMLPTLIKFMGQIGDYFEVERYITDDEGNIVPVFGDFSYRYGLFSSLRDTFIVFFVGMFLILFVLNLLPPIIRYTLMMVGVLILFLNYIVYPLLVDIVQLASKEDPSEMLVAKKKAFFRFLIISSLVFSVAAAIILPLLARTTLNTNESVADYYKTQGTANLLADIDLNAATRDIDDLWLRCELNYESDVDIAENYAFPGCQISMFFNPISLRWEIEEIIFLGHGKITGAVCFKGEGAEGTHRSKGTAELTVFFESANAGTVTIKDNATGEELLSTSFVIGEYDAYYKGYKMTLQEGIWSTYFGYSTFYLCSDETNPEQVTMLNDLKDGFQLTLQQ